MLKKYKEPLLLLGIMAFTVIMFIASGDIRMGRGRTPVGPATWPRFMLGGMMLFSIILFVNDMRKLRKGESLEPEQAAEEYADTADLASEGVESLKHGEESMDGSGSDAEHYPHRALFTLIFLVGFLLLLPVTGFVFTTIVLLFSYLLSLKIKLKLSFLLATVSTFVLVYLFPHVLSVPLPRGIGAFREMTKVFY